MSVATENSAGATAIRPFTIPVTPEAEIETLRSRIAAMRWPEKDTDADQSQDVQLATKNKLGFFDVKEVSVPAAVSVFPRSSIRRRGAGPSRPTTTSSTSTKSTRAATSPPGRSRTSSRPRFGPRSGHYAKGRSS
jgi:hypothetical protein